MRPRFFLLPWLALVALALPAHAAPDEQLLGKDAGYPIGKVTPPLRSAMKVAFGIIVIAFISGMTYGPVAAMLVELFPARVRYTSLSIPYHIGSGYFGGFLPFINQYIVAKTGDPFAGLWYTIGVTGMALLIVSLAIPETSGRNLE